MTPEGEMTYTLIDYDYSVVRQHQDDLRRDADRARVRRAARKSRRERHAGSNRASFRLSPAR
jgi:hypothetical protein